MQIRDFIQKLRALPDQKKKLIIVVIVVLLAFVFGFFWVRSAGQRLSKIGETAGDIKLPQINIPKVESLVADETKNWKTHTNRKYSFEIKYPNDWQLNNILISDLEFFLEKNVDNISADIHLEIVSQTQKVETSESGIDNEILKMKNIVIPKTKIKVGGYDGFETIGTLCTSICTGSKEDIYSLFSIIYFFDGKNVYRTEFIEGVSGVGGKENILDWKYYNDFKNIITTFKFVNK